jgi:hypothetical protein
MSPADADTTIVRLRIAAAHIWRKVLILFAPKHEIQNFCFLQESCKHTRAALNLVARAGGAGVRFARSSPDVPLLQMVLTWPYRPHSCAS